jgi:hypothetical protein
MPGRQSTKRFSGLPLLAGGTDVGPGPVQLVAGSWAVIPVANNTQQVMGIARASAPNGSAVDVRDLPDIHIGTAAASIAAGAFIGVASANPVAGASGNFLVPQLAEVSKATGSNRWAIGQAVEGAAPGNNFSYYFLPQQLSGLS